MAMVGYWKFNGNSNDYSGNGYNGTDSNIAYSQANGRLGQGAGFNGLSSSIVTPTIDYNSSKKLTISFWFYPKAASTFCIFESSSNYNANAGSFTLFFLNTQKFEFAEASLSGTNYSAYDFGSSIVLNKWHHVVCIIDKSLSGQKVFMWIDGKSASGTLVRNDDSSTTRTLSNYPLYIGARGGTSLFANMNIDEISIDNTIFSPAKIINERSKALGFF